ncbi:MAG: dihydrofolate reductase [Vallitaleaceae bacterium]|nr:dihydrofolate reductase [Vallitaleaceae bacterium]
MIALIVAYTKDRVIGKGGQIPWKIKGEQLRFKELTTGQIVIFGRVSYDEIGRPLPNRKTIVISKTKKYEAENCTTVESLEEALLLARGQDVYISGGARLYEEALPLVDVMYITEIEAQIEGDRYFPEFDEEDFEKEIIRRVEGEIPYTYLTYKRKGMKIC